MGHAARQSGVGIACHAKCSAWAWEKDGTAPRATPMFVKGPKAGVSGSIPPSKKVPPKQSQDTLGVQNLGITLETPHPKPKPPTSGP